MVRLVTTVALALAVLAPGAEGVTVEGRVLYQNFPPGPAGYEAPFELPMRGIDVEVTRLDGTPVSVATTRTGSDGIFRVDVADLPIGSRVGITLRASSSAATVEDNLGNTYAWTTNEDPDTVSSDPFILGTVVIDEAHDAGALNILDVINGEIEYAAVRGAADLPSVTAVWTKGSAVGTFYSDSVIYLLNSGSMPNDDNDEWDDHVIAHEYAHHLQRHRSCDMSEGGPWGLCGQASASKAWNEGVANYLSVLVSTADSQLDDFGSIYLDLMGTFAQGSEVIGRIDLEENDVCGSVEGRLAPGVASNLLWDLQDERVDPPDAYTRSESDIFRLILSLRDASHCNVDAFVSAMCGGYPADFAEFGVIMASFHVTPQAECPNPPRLTGDPVSRAGSPRRVDFRPP